MQAFNFKREGEAFMIIHVSIYLIRSHCFVSGMGPFEPPASYKSQGGVYVSDADGCTIWKKTTTGAKSLVVGSELSHGALHIVTAVSVMMWWECH